MVTAAGRTPAQIFGVVVGAVYLVVGLLGFLVTGFDQFASDTHEALLGFDVNPLHNIVHILIGLALLSGLGSHPAAKGVNLGVGLSYLVVAVLGLPGWLQFLSINAGLVPDFWLHLVTGLLAIYFGTVGAGSLRAART